MNDDISDPPDLKRARALWQANRHAEACELFASVAERYPDSPRALADAARAFGQCYRIRKAGEYLQRLEALRPDDPGIAFAVAQSYRMIHREDHALERLTEFVRGPGRRHAGAHLELAVLSERRHRLADAAAAADTALKLAPQLAEALIIKARLYRRNGEAGRARTALQRVTKSGVAHPMTKAQAWAALASLADGEGDYAEAVRLMERSKEILRPHAAIPQRHADTVLGHLKAFGMEVTAEDFRRWQAAAPGAPARVAQLNGFPRSGTTLLENILDAHPGLISSEEREVFGRDIMGALTSGPGGTTPPSVAGLNRIPPARLEELRRDYLSAMEEAADEVIGDRVHLDKNPTNTLFLPAIVRVFPETRFIIALRDPRDVVVSCWFQFLPLNPNSVAFLSWQSAAERYALDLGMWLRWRELLAPASWIEVRYEDVVASLGTQARRTLGFLGLPWDDRVLEYRSRIAGKTVHTPTYIDVARPVYSGSIGRWRNYLPWLEPHLKVLEPFLREFGYAD